MDDKGDLLIENGQIQMVYDTELTAQKIKTVLGTQKGEWFLNWEEGIDHNSFLGKKQYAKKTSGIENRYVEEITELKQTIAVNEENHLNKLLAKRLDGEL